MAPEIMNIIAEILECEPTDDMKSVEINSIKILQIIMALDEKGISIPIESISNISSVGNLLSTIDKNIQ